MSQKVEAGPEATVIVSARDTTIGYTKEDMKEIMGVVAAQLPQYAAMASAIVDQRLEIFEKKILHRFETGKGANPQAFADPDFQYLLGRSQHAFARSGDEVTAEILVDLIAQRSLQSARTRLALSLNDAVEKSAYLTSNEFAELSIVFALSMVSNSRVTNFAALCNFIRSITEPFLPDVSANESSYLYLQSQSCGQVDFLGRPDLMTAWKLQYGGLITKGNTEQKFLDILGADIQKNYPNLLRVSLHHPSQLQVNAVNREVLVQMCVSHNIEEKAEELWNLTAEGFLSEEEFVSAAQPHYPGIQNVFTAWKDSPLGSLRLTSVGIAIGYANLARVVGLDADLSIWID